MGARTRLIYVFRFGKYVRVADANHEWFGRGGRIVSTHDPDSPMIEWMDTVFDTRRYSPMPASQLVTYQERFNSRKWRQITRLSSLAA